MNQQAYQQFDSKTIETLKTARNQVMRADSRNEGENANRGENQNPREAPNQTSVAASVGSQTRELSRKAELPSQGQTRFGARSKFAEEFVQKLASLERETAAVDEEMAKTEKIWSSLVEKKKQLEARRNELIKVKDKLKELDKEMSGVLKSQSFDKLRIDPE